MVRRRASPSRPKEQLGVGPAESVPASGFAYRRDRRPGRRAVPPRADRPSPRRQNRLIAEAASPGPATLAKPTQECSKDRSIEVYGDAFAQETEWAYAGWSPGAEESGAQRIRSRKSARDEG